MEEPVSRTRLWAALASVAGVVTLVITAAFRILPEVQAAGTCVASDAVLRFEFARTLSDLQAIFGPCPAQAMAAMDAINRLDVWAYIPSYTAFAVFAALFLGERLRRPLVMAAVAAAGVALVADYVETLTLLKITADPDGALPRLAVSSGAAWIKFGALAANAALLSALCFQGPPRRRIVGALLLLPALATIVAAVDLSRSSLITLAYLASWTPLMALTIRHAATGRSA